MCLQKITAHIISLYLSGLCPVHWSPFLARVSWVQRKLGGGKREQNRLEGGPPTNMVNHGARSIELSLQYLKCNSKEIILKPEQEQAIRGLLLGRDVVAVLPTGFGKSIIFTVFALAKSFELKENSTPISVLIVAPLQSLIEDQIMAMLDIQCTAIQLSPSTVEKILEDPPQFVFATAEQVLEKRFHPLHCRVSAVIVDESHTIETWSGKR